MIQVLRPDEVNELFSIIISNPREQLYGIPLFEYFCELSQSGQIIAMRSSDLFKTPYISISTQVSCKYFTLDEENHLVLFKDVSSLIKGLCYIQKHSHDCPSYMVLAPRVLNVIQTALDTDEMLERLSSITC